MISIDKLKNVKRLITHANCPDGIASALIIKDALPDVEVLFVKHGTKEHRELRPDVPTLFCDFTPWTDVKKDAQWLMWIDAGTIVLDHHPTQRDVTTAFVEAGLGAYGENDRGECGAWLAYEHVWRPIKLGHGPFNPHDDGESVKRFAELAGVRDTWKKDDPRWQAACEQAEMLMFWGFDELSLDAISCGIWHRIGPHLFKKKLEHARTAIDESHRFQTTKGTRVLMFQGVTPTSDAAELLEQEPSIGFGSGCDPRLPFASRKDLEKSIGADATANIVYDAARATPIDIVAGFHYRVDAGKLQLQFSTRSHTGYDVGAFCKSRGGGGHKAAAGFTLEESVTNSANPYAVFEMVLMEWEQGR